MFRLLALAELEIDLRRPVVRLEIHAEDFRKDLPGLHFTAETVCKVSSIYLIVHQGSG